MLVQLAAQLGSALPDSAEPLQQSETEWVGSSELVVAVAVQRTSLQVSIELVALELIGQVLLQVVGLAVELAAELAAGPAFEPVAELVDGPVVGLVVGLYVEQVAEPTVETAFEQAVELAFEPVGELVVGLASEQAVGPTGIPMVELVAAEQTSFAVGKNYGPGMAVHFLLKRMIATVRTEIVEFVAAAQMAD